jgi:effector-binding domain-containing protein
MSLTEPKIVEVQAQDVLEIRRTIPMSELPEFYHDALSRLGAYVGGKGIAPVGPPYGITRGGPPGETIDIAAAMPVAEPRAGDGDIAPAALPAGRAATVTLTGPYDELANSYSTLMTWMTQNGHASGDVAWEQYLTMPEEGGDPSQNITQIWWLLA